MTTAAQIKRLVRPLLARHDDLVLKGQWIFLRPVHHVARFILIDRTGEAARFRPRWGATPLVDRTDVLSIGWGAMLSHPVGVLWMWDDPTIQDALIEVVESQALPHLRALETLDQFVAFSSSRDRFPLGTFDQYLLLRVAVDVARGDLAGARSACDQLMSGRTRWSMPLLRDSFARIVEALCPLIGANDRMGLAALLHDWEAYSAKHAGLEGVWERTPFPLELQAVG
jgi:hypothetical protein